MKATTWAALGMMLSPQMMICQSVDSGRAEFVEWAARSTRSLPSARPTDPAAKDLRWIYTLVSKARVLGIGESAHDVHDFLELRGSITKALIEQGRVAAIVMESGLAEGAPIDEWVTGRAFRSPDFATDLSYGMGQEAELVSTLKWIHEHNAHLPPERQVRVYGADLPANGGGSLQPALTPVWSYLTPIDSAYSRSASERIEPIAHRLEGTNPFDIVGKYAQLSPPARDSLRGALSSLAEHFARHRRDYIAKSSAAEFEWIQRLVEVARQTEEAARIGWNDSTNPRDKAMAANIEWIQAREGRRGLVVVWAHNLHVARALITGPIFAQRGGPPVKSMGQYLQTAFGDRYVAIGTAFATGAPDSTKASPSSVDAALSELRNPRFGVVLDDAPARGAAATWLEQPRLMRAEDGYAIVRLRAAYDALLFLDSVRMADHLN